MSSTVAARAALSTYAAARRSGAAANIAIDVALARYRSYLPLACELELRNILAHALAIERLRERGLIPRPPAIPPRMPAACRQVVELAADPARDADAAAGHPA